MLVVEDVDSHLSVAWGIVVGLIASCVQSLGLTMQRKSHVLNEQLPKQQQRVDFRRPLWLLGFAVFITSNILGSVFQIASLPVVILAPLGAVSLLWNAFFARLLLGDVFSLWMVFGTIFIAGGAVLIAIFGIVPEPTHSLKDLLVLFGRPAFIAYFSLLGAAVLACLVITHITEFSLRRLSPLPPVTPPELPEPVTVLPQAMAPPPSHAVAATETTPLLDRKSLTTPGLDTHTHATIKNHARTKLALAISYASVSGILSGMCLLFAKSGVELLMLTIGGDNQFWRWEAWMLVVGLVAFALLQLWYLQKSLVFADPTIVCPLAFCFYNLSSIVNGLVYYDQFAMLSALKLSLVSVGMVVLLGGVWVVSIHAGSGRVDVGTWQEGDEDLDDWEEVAASQPLESRETGPSAFFSPRLEATLSESAAYRARLPTSPNTVHESSFTFSPGSDPTEYLPQPFTLQPTVSHGSGRPKVHRKRRISLLHPSDTSTLPGGGFSIGLSPVSPGFVIVPKKRISGMRRVVQRAIMRRTVSESDIRAGLLSSQRTGNNQTPVPSAPNAGAAEEGVGAEGESERQKRAKHFRAMARWQWLRGVFKDRDS